MENIGANSLEGSNNPIIDNPGNIDEKRGSIDQKVDDVANKQLNTQNSQTPPSLEGRVSEGFVSSDLEDIESIVNDEDLSIYEIDNLLKICKRTLVQKGSLTEANHRLVQEALSKSINNQSFQEILFSTIEKIRFPEIKIMKMMDIAKLPFLEEGEFKTKLTERASILCKPIISKNELLHEEDRQLMGGTSMVAFAQEGNCFFEEEPFLNRAAETPKDRFSFILNKFLKRQEYIVSIGNKSFNCLVNTDGSVIIKDKSRIFLEIDSPSSEEGYKAKFRNTKTAAVFLCFQNKAYLESRELSISWCTVSLIKYNLYKVDLDHDLKVLENITKEKFDSGNLYIIGEVIDKVNVFNNYCPEYRDKLIKLLLLKINEIYESKDLDIRFDEFIRQERAFDLICALQKLPKVPNDPYFFSQNLKYSMDKKWNELQEKICRTLFQSITFTIGGVNQENLEDEELGIKKKGANYCCGSMSVGALIESVRKTGITLNEILKKGFIRHQKLPPLQMSKLTTIEMILQHNLEEITSSGPSYKEIGLNFHDSEIKRYSKFFSKIPDGTSGILQVGTCFLMCSFHDDGKIELFDSHGSSVPLIFGGKNPAYRAFFDERDNFYTHLAVYRKPYRGDLIFFHPIEVL